LSGFERVTDSEPISEPISESISERKPEPFSFAIM
jgi:hypothetical protein